MKLEDWHESVQGYVIDCLDWFDLERYDRQAKNWDVSQWRNAIVKRLLLARMSKEVLPKEELNKMFIYLNDDTKNDIFFGTPKTSGWFGPLCYHDDLSGLNLIPFYVELAKQCGGIYIVPPKIKPCVQSLSCESAYNLYEDMDDNILFENEKSYRYGISHDIDVNNESVTTLTEGDYPVYAVKIAESFQPRLKTNEWMKPYHEIAYTNFGSSIAQKIVEINLAAPKDKIISAFENWLDKAKNDFDYPDPTPRPERNSLKLETQHFQKWMDWRLLAFIDFAFWRKMNGKEKLSKKSQYLHVIFPDPKVKTSTLFKPYEIIKEAKWLMLPSTVSLLDAATETYPRNHPAVLNPPRP